MATCDELVRGAFRRAGISRDLAEVRPREMERGLQVFQDLLLELIAGGAFGRFNDVIVDEDYTAEEQDRILVTDTSAITITLPETVDDDLVGDRPPLDGSIIAVTDVATLDRATFIYDAAYAAWTQIEDLTLSSFAPLSIRYRSGLEAKLAVRLSEENGMAVTPELRRQEAQGTLALLHRFDAPETASSSSNYF